MSFSFFFFFLVAKYQNGPSSSWNKHTLYSCAWIFVANYRKYHVTDKQCSKARREKHIFPIWSHFFQKAVRRRASGSPENWHVCIHEAQWPHRAAVGAHAVLWKAPCPSWGRGSDTLNRGLGSQFRVDCALGCQSQLLWLILYSLRAEVTGSPGCVLVTDTFLFFCYSLFYIQW